MNAIRPLIAGNWKMHGLSAQLDEIENIAAAVHARPPAADVLICVPATLLYRAVQAAAGRIALGGEDCHAEASGPFTGDISAGMLKDAGAAAVIVGHSERRLHHAETDPMVAAKAAAAWRCGLSTIVCIGETEVQRRNGDALTVCGHQAIAHAVPHLQPGETAEVNAGCALAHSPIAVLAPGTGPGEAFLIWSGQDYIACASEGRPPISHRPTRSRPTCGNSSPSVSATRPLNGFTPVPACRTFTTSCCPATRPRRASFLAVLDTAHDRTPAIMQAALHDADNNPLAA
jgi:triosephosphate isomerase